MNAETMFILAYVLCALYGAGIVLWTDRILTYRAFGVYILLSGALGAFATLAVYPLTMDKPWRALTCGILTVILMFWILQKGRK